MAPVQERFDDFGNQIDEKGNIIKTREQFEAEELQRAAQEKERKKVAQEKAAQEKAAQEKAARDKAAKEASALAEAERLKKVRDILDGTENEGNMSQNPMFNFSGMRGQLDNTGAPNWNTPDRTMYEGLGAIPRIGGRYPVSSTRMDDSLALYSDAYLPPIPEMSIEKKASPIETLLNDYTGPPPKTHQEKLNSLNTEKPEALIRFAVEVLDTIVNKKDHVKRYREKPVTPVMTDFGSLSLDTTQNTLPEMYGQNYLSTQFDNSIDPLTKALVKQQTLTKALIDLPNTEANKEKRKLLSQEMEKVDLVSSMKVFAQSLIEQGISKQVHIGVEHFGNSETVNCPTLGVEHVVQAADYKLLATTVNGKQYGNGNTRSGIFYLKCIASIINLKYSANAAFDICSYVMSGPYLAFVQNASKNNTNFRSFWMTFSSILSSETRTKAQSAAKELFALLQKPPAKNLPTTLLEINNLVSAKLENPEFSAIERKQLFSLEIRKFIFVYLERHYVYYVSLCREHYNRIISRPGVDLSEMDHFGVLYSVILRVVGDSPPSRGYHQPGVNVNSTDAIPADQLDDVDMLPFQANFKGHQGQQGRQGFQGGQDQRGGNQNKVRLNVPDSHKQACLFCRSKLHRMADCDRYPGDTLASSSCRTCGNFHSSKCKNLENGVFASETAAAANTAENN